MGPAGPAETAPPGGRGRTPGPGKERRGPQAIFIIQYHIPRPAATQKREKGRRGGKSPVPSQPQVFQKGLQLGLGLHRDALLQLLGILGGQKMGIDIIDLFWFLGPGLVHRHPAALVPQDVGGGILLLAAVPEGRQAKRQQQEEIEEPRTSLRTIRRALRTIVRENSDEDDWIIIGKIGNLLDKRYPDFDVRNFGFSKLTPFLESLDMFEIRDMKKDGNSSPQKYVRLK